jgi:hypothetical protein
VNARVLSARGVVCLLLAQALYTQVDDQAILEVSLGRGYKADRPASARHEAFHQQSRFHHGMRLLDEVAEYAP